MLLVQRYAHNINLLKFLLSPVKLTLKYVPIFAGTATLWQIFYIICTFKYGRYIVYSQVFARQLFRAGVALHQSRRVDVELEFEVS